MSYSYRSSVHRTAGKPRYQNNRSRGVAKGGQYINPARFVKVASPTNSEDYTPKHNFADFQITQLLKSNLTHKGYITPTPIQDQTIAVGLEGNDVIGIANTGTGKTAAFGLPILNQLINNRDSKALVIAPTRELAKQIEDEFRWMARGSGLFSVLLIGGSAMTPQLRGLRENPRIVIGTPGRIKDHIERKTLRLASFNMIALDEVDRMLDMGFVHDVRSILSEVSSQRQSFFFSATVDARVSDLIRTFANDPISVSVKSGETSENIHQNVVNYVSTGDKTDKLHNILASPEAKKVLVFDETKRSVDRLSRTLVEHGFSADSIHGGKSQGQRQRALNKFKANEISILVATDVAARGIDVSDITHVINFSMPRTYDDYIHRIGRAGRAGNIGHALTFVSH